MNSTNRLLMICMLSAIIVSFGQSSSLQPASTPVYYASAQTEPAITTTRIYQRSHIRHCCRRYRRTSHGRRYRRYGYTYRPIGPYWGYYRAPRYYDYGIYGGVGFGGSFYI